MSIEFLRNLAWTIAGIAVAGFFAVATHQVARNGDGLAATNAEAQRAARVVADYAEKQAAILGSEKNQKAIEAGWQTPAILNGTAKLLNKTTLPELNSAVRELRAQTAQVGQAAKEALDQHAALAGTLNDDSRQVLQGLAALTDEGRQIGQQINRLLASSRLPEIEDRLLNLLSHADATAAEVERAAKDIAKLTPRGEEVTDEVKQLIVQARASLKAGEGTLNTVRKVSLVQVVANVLFGIAKLAF